MRSKVKVAVTDYIESDLNWEAQELEKAGILLETYQLKFRPEDEVYEKIKDADLLVVNMVRMTKSLLQRLPRCRAIIRHGIGYDNVDVATCTRLGILLAYQPDYCKEDVAEHAIALLFACARKIVRSRRTLEESSACGQWDFHGLFPLYRLDGKTLGILGVGRIGSRVHRKMRTFGFRILGCDPYLSPERRRELEEAGLHFVNHDTLFRESDFLTVHTPLTDETRHIVNARTLALMKPTAYLINTSRGPMVDAEALAAALRAGTIAGAALDVFDIEPPPPDYPLFGLENCILTPHIAWASEEAGWEIRRSILDDLLAMAAGRPARCVVNPEVLPYWRGRGEGGVPQ